MKTTAHRALWAALLTICLAGTIGARDIKVGMVLPLSGGGAQFGDQYMMRVRAGRLEHPRAWSQSPRNRTNHVVSNVIIEHEEPETGEIVARAKFIMVEFRLDEQRYFTGTYRHHLVRTSEGLRIQLQRVDLLNYDGPYDYVLQYWV